MHKQERLQIYGFPERERGDNILDLEVRTEPTSEKVLEPTLIQALPLDLSARLHNIPEHVRDLIDFNDVNKVTKPKF